jgi:hypothetical protein
MRSSNVASWSIAFQQPGIYHSYLVRLWQDNAQAPWRASLQSVQTGETVRFGDLDALFAFLAAQTARQPADHPDQGQRGSKEDM